MLRRTLVLCRKDLLLILFRGAGLSQALLLGLLLIFLFSLALEPGERPSPQAVSAMFWLSSTFCQILIFHLVYDLEEAGQTRLGLLLLPVPVQAVLMGKGLAGLTLMLIAQCLFMPACFVFLGQSPGPAWCVALAGLMLTNVGAAACGSLLGALSTGKTGRESLLSIVLFPLLLPLLLAGTRLGAVGLNPDGAGQDAQSWLGLAGAFDAVFLAAGLVLFPFVYSGEDG